MGVIMDNFTHLHVHTQYSFLDGQCKLKELIPRAKELGMSAIAMTDHNHIGGAFEFQKVCKEHGIKPIIGLEAYYTDDTNILSLSADERTKLAADDALEDKAITEDEYKVITKESKNAKIKITEVREKIKPYQYKTNGHHIIFLVMNQTGWNNLIKLNSESAKKCTFNARFYCDNEIIRKYSEGLICTTACIANKIARYIHKDNDYEKAEELLKEWIDIFGDRLYLEIQSLLLEEQIKTNLFYIDMAKKYNLKIIATTDVHYILESDYKYHQILIMLGTGRTINSEKKDNDLDYINTYWLKSYDEMVASFKQQYEEYADQLPENYMDIIKEALAETNNVSNRIENNIKLGSDVPLIPQVKLPDGKTAEMVLTMRCWNSLYNLALKDEYVKEHIKDYEKRLAAELKVIIPKGFASYLLVVDEYVSWANSNGCITGPGRGSAAGSLCLYLLGITKNIDPIKNDLLFERFLTADRTALPDIDTDFLNNLRPKVIEHLEDYYGKECVCHVGTYTEMGVKSGLKDVGRVLEIPFSTMNEVSKLLDTILDIPQPKFKDFDELKESNLVAWKAFNDLEEKNKELFEIARKFEGLKRNFGVHASAVLAMPIPINDMVPYRIADNVRISLFTGPEIEELNLLKNDILGLKSIDIIMLTLRHIDKDMTIEDLYDKVDVNDENIFEMLSNKRTEAVFQLESDMFKGIISEVKPTGIDDIVAITSLGRPGPLSAGMPQSYAKRKNNEEESVPLLRGMESILEKTYGNIIYQEQIMQIGVKALGFNMNQADSLIRKIFAKKKKDKMEMLRRMMKYGKINSSGVDNWKDNPNLPWYDPKGEYGPPIAGGIVNGYTDKEMDDFWNTIQGFADYLFNLSHAASYSYISILTAWLKCYHPVEFYAAVLSMQDNDDKIKKYVEVAEAEGIKIIVPDINISNEKFTPNSENKSIYYGLSSIKGVGDAALSEIIANKPYMSIDDLFEKLPKKVLNKRVALALAKSGALDSFDINKDRCAIINEIMKKRKEKDFVSYPDRYYCDEVCMEFETEVLSVPITCKPWWSTVNINSRLTKQKATIASVREQQDKNKNLMAFAKLRMNNCEVEAVIFAKTYTSSIGLFDPNVNLKQEILVNGKKDDKGKLVVSKVFSAQDEPEDAFDI